MDHTLDFWWELALLIVIMLLGHWIEMRSLSQTSSALDSLAALLPDEAERVVGESVETVPTAALATGDLVIVRPGARVPSDGTVVEGSADMDADAKRETARSIRADVDAIVRAVRELVAEWPDADSITLRAGITNLTDKQPLVVAGTAVHDIDAAGGGDPGRSAPRGAGRTHLPAGPAVRAGRRGARQQWPAGRRRRHRPQHQFLNRPRRYLLHKPDHHRLPAHP